MIKIVYLLMIANQFLTERNWWPYHNFKNDTLNIVAEVGELAEHFVVTDEIQQKHEEIAQEISDVLFAVFTFALLAKIDISHSIGLEVGDSSLSDEHCSYEELKKVVMSHLDVFGLNNITDPQQVVMSLVVQTSQLADIFVWSSVEQSALRAQEKYTYLSKRVAHSIAHLIFLSTLVDIDIPQEYIDKMEYNAVKYPTDTSSIDEYNKIKDESRGDNR